MPRLVAHVVDKKTRVWRLVANEQLTVGRGSAIGAQSSPVVSLCPGTKWPSQSFATWITTEAAMLRPVIVLAISVFAVSAFAQTGGSGGAAGGGTAGGALGTTSASPGTNSAGTAVPSGGAPRGASATGTGDPLVEKQDKKVDRKIKSICKGC